MNITIIRNANIYAPEKLGIKDLLVCNGKIIMVDEKIELTSVSHSEIDAGGMIVTPGFIDQHMHIIGAGGKSGYFSITPEVQPSELIRCGTTTVVGLLGTDGITKELTTLYAKCKSLEQYGIGAYMLTSYFAVPPKTIMNSVAEDMLFIDKIIGCKVAISDERCSFPTKEELLRLINQVHTGGLTSGKGGVLHIHLGALPSRMQLLLEIAREYPNCKITTEYARTEPMEEVPNSDVYHLLWSSDRLEIAREVDSRITKIYADLVSLEKMMHYKRNIIDVLKDVLPGLDTDEGRRLTLVEECHDRWVENARTSRSGRKEVRP